MWSCALAIGHGLHSIVALIADWLPVIYRASLYFIPIFLSPFVDKVVPILYSGEWPSRNMLAGCSIVGLVAGCITLRSFSDGSVQQHIVKLANGHKPAGPDTTFFEKASLAKQQQKP